MSFRERNVNTIEKIHSVDLAVKGKVNELPLTPLRLMTFRGWVYEQTSLQIVVRENYLLVNGKGWGRMFFKEVKFVFKVI